jgi:hypothetical protein
METHILRNDIFQQKGKTSSRKRKIIQNVIDFFLPMSLMATNDLLDDMTNTQRQYERNTCTHIWKQKW